MNHQTHRGRETCCKMSQRGACILQRMPNPTDDASTMSTSNCNGTVCMTIHCGSFSYNLPLCPRHNPPRMCLECNQPSSVEVEEFRSLVQQAPRPKLSADVSTWLGTRCILCFQYTLHVPVKSDQCRMAHRGGAAPTTWSREHLQGHVPTSFVEVRCSTTATGMLVPHPVHCMLQPSPAGAKAPHG